MATRNTSLGDLHRPQRGYAGKSSLLEVMRPNFKLRGIANASALVGLQQHEDTASNDMIFLRQRPLKQLDKLNHSVVEVRVPDMALAPQNKYSEGYHLLLQKNKGKAFLKQACVTKDFTHSLSQYARMKHTKYQLGRLQGSKGNLSEIKLRDQFRDSKSNNHDLIGEQELIEEA